MNLLFVLLAAGGIPFLKIALVIIVVGVLLWLVTTYIPMYPVIKNFLVAVVVIGLVIWILKITGLWSYLF